MLSVRLYESEEQERETTSVDKLFIRKYIINN